MAGSKINRGGISVGSLPIAAGILISTFCGSLQAKSLQQNVLDRLGVNSSGALASTAFTAAEQKKLKSLAARNGLAISLTELDSDNNPRETISYNDKRDFCAASMAKVISIATLYNLRRKGNPEAILNREQLETARQAIFKSNNESACKTFKWVTKATGDTCAANNYMKDLGLRIRVGETYCGRVSNKCEGDIEYRDPPQGVNIGTQIGNAHSFMEFWLRFSRNKLVPPGTPATEAVPLHREMENIFENKPKASGYGLPLALHNVGAQPVKFYRKGGSLDSRALGTTCMNDSGYVELPDHRKYAISVMINDKLENMGRPAGYVLITKIMTEIMKAIDAGEGANEPYDAPTGVVRKTKSAR